MSFTINFLSACLVLLLTAGGVAFAAPDVMGLRIGSGETKFERYKEYGYNAVILSDVTQLASYDTVYPDVIAKDSPLWTGLEEHRKKFASASERARALGLAVCLLTDEVSLPIPVLERLQKSCPNAGTPACAEFDSAEFWKLYRAKYREVLRAYPSVAYVIVRTGENYSHPEQGFAGHTIGNGKIDDAYYANMQRLIEETRKVVVDEFGRTLIWRTWDLGNNGFHANPKVYDRVLQGLTNRKGLILSIKHTQTDFWLYNDFNPMIGRDHVDQIVEFQCAREYEGKGAFPNYAGPIYAEAMRKARDLGVKGIWVWDFGGGWGGPFLKSDRWVRLNIEAVTRLAQNPDMSPRTLAQEWAAREFGPAAATNVAEMLMLSGECVRKFMYIEAYARNHRGWMPSLNLMRDDIIRGTVLKPLYEGCKNALPQVIAEKEEAVALAARMRALLESSRQSIVAERGEDVYQSAASSLIYLESLATVMRHCVNGMFLYYQWQETGAPAIADQARRELEAWRGAWDRYQTETPKLPDVASPYRSQNAQDSASAKGAMADLCEKALHSLSSASASASPSSPNSKSK